MRRLSLMLAMLLLLLNPSMGDPDERLNVIHDQDIVFCCGVDFSGSGFCQSMTYYNCFSFYGRVVSDCSECEHYRPGE